MFGGPDRALPGRMADRPATLDVRAHLTSREDLSEARHDARPGDSVDP
jgi:hypothetical protein